MPSPLISVVIPTYCREASLARCLDCLAPARQTLPETRYEVLVTDDSPEHAPVADLLRGRYPWVRAISGPRRGPAANRNHGARHARGSWLAFTDDDCLPAAEWLSSLAAQVTENGPRVLEGCTTDGGEPWGPWRSAPTNDQGGCLWSCNMAVEKSFFFEIGEFDENFPSPHMEDVEFRLRLEDGGHAYAFVPRALVVHPPRPQRTIWQWARAQESYFYLARKRRTTLTHAGLSAGGMLRGWRQCFRHCRTGMETILMIGRLSLEAGALLYLLPGWWRRYRN